jgi:hypothetical protein
MQVQMNMQTPLAPQMPYVQGPHVQAPHLQGPHVQGPHVQGMNVQGPYVQGPHVQTPYVQPPVLQPGALPASQTTIPPATVTARGPANNMVLLAIIAVLFFVIGVIVTFLIVR